MHSLRLLSAAVAFTVLFSSCSKDDNTTTPAPKAFSYAIDGVSDVRIKQGDVLNVPVTVRPVSGAAETVSLVASGVPENAQIGFTPASGEPAFTSTMTTVVAQSVKTGTYPLKVVGTSKSGIVVEKAFNLTVRNWNCAMDFNNLTMSGTRACSLLPGGSFQSKITASPAYPEINISNFANFGNSVVLECSLDCDNNTLFIRSQTFTNNNGTSFSLNGDGTFSENELQIRFFYSDSDRNSDQCTVTYKL